jgi:hypothetical protein
MKFRRHAGCAHSLGWGLGWRRDLSTAISTLGRRQIGGLSSDREVECLCGRACSRGARDGGD